MRSTSPLIIKNTPLSTAVIATLALAGTAFGDATWIGSTSQNWNDGSNWTASPPTGNFIINTATTIFPTLAVDPAFTPSDVLVGSGVGNSGRFDQTGGALAVAFTGAEDHNGNWFMVGRDNGTGSYSLTGAGSLNVGKLQAGGSYYAPGGVGTITINTTGTVTANSNATFDYVFGGSSYASIVLGVGNFGPDLGTGTLNLQNGTVNAFGETHVGSHGGTGTLNMTGGVLNTSSLVLTKWRGTGTVNVSNATVNAGSVNLTQGGSNTDLNTGTMTVGTGGTVNSEGDLIVASAGNNDSVGTLNVNAGGVINVGTTIERWFIVSLFDGVKSVVNVDGGTINLNANTDFRFSTGGNFGASVVNLNSGAITGWAGNGSASGASTDTVLDLNRGNNTTVNNTFNLNGGTLTVNGILATNAAGGRTFNFNGGVLKAAGNNEAFVTGIDNLYVKSGGARIDTNGHDVAIAVPLISADGSTGGLVKSGAGTLSLTGVNGYTGRTVVQGGTLKVNYSNVLAAAATPLLTGGGLDLQNGKVILDYAGSPTPASTVRGLLTTSRAANFASGQLRSTTATDKRGIGYADNGTGQVTLMATLYGDADLDGGVSINDFNALAGNFGQANGRVWTQGDFDYDGGVSINDFNLLAGNFGQTLPASSEAWAELLAFAAAHNDLEAFAAITGVPEPTGLGLIAAGVTLGVRRRRR